MTRLAESPGRPLERHGNVSPREMTVHGASAPGQNPAYRPAHSPSPDLSDRCTSDRLLVGSAVGTGAASAVHAKLASMNRLQAVTLTGCALVVAGLLALASPMITALGSPTSDDGESVTPEVEYAIAPEALEAAAAEAARDTMPDWAKSTTWLVYPEDFECVGTEGCPNDYRAFFGEPPAVLPPNVQVYDPAVHTWVFPAP